MDAQNSRFRLSVAVPIHNEETVLLELIRRLNAALDKVPGGPHEMVFVDDGSTDDSPRILDEFARGDSRILVITLSRNFGHQAALTAGLDHVTGDATVLMDGDLQDVPEAIPQFVKRFFDGYEVVYAQRIRRKEPWPLRLCYFLFYRMMSKLSDVPLPLDSGDFSLMSRRVVEQLRQMPEHHRYLRGIRTWVGFKQVGIRIERGGRHSGKSKYSLLRLIKLASDGLFAFSIVPIRAAALLGAVAMLLAGLYTLYALYAKLVLHQSPQGFTGLIVTGTFLAGILLFFLGIIGEYVGRVYEETKGRPQYLIARMNGYGEREMATASQQTRSSLGSAIR